MNAYFFAAAGLILGAVLGAYLRKLWILRGAASLEERLQEKIKKAEEKVKDIEAEAEKKASSILDLAKNEAKEREAKLGATEDRLLQREENLERKSSEFEKKEKELEERKAGIQSLEAEVAKMKEETRTSLEKISGLSEKEAREKLISEMKENAQQELAQTLQKLDKERREEIEKKSVDILTTALQRYARSHVSELTTTIFHLNNEELKGKIIGREGRNIKALERATGTELMIDETPDTIIISSFDPYRREVARIALDKLIKDGRIQPAKIEEKVEEAKQELEKRIAELGEEAASETGIYDLPKEILNLLGRLHFRTSFGQNVLTHSIETAYLAEMMAAELGLNASVAKKGALLHDVGKAIDHEVEGTHVELGIKILKKYGIDEKVIQAMQSHHDDYPYAIPEAYVVTAADALSAARPGARRGTLENYVKRLADLEKIAGEFEGIKNAYAISAGRELRVFVVPEKVDDFRALELAREIANRIQSELKYPGEIKVNVIREMRAVEYAK